MNREQLLDHASSYIQRLKKNPSDAERLSKLMSREIYIPRPYAGARLTFEGCVKFMEDLHSASSDIAFQIFDTCIDEVQSSVTLIIIVTGTHGGFGIPLDDSDRG